MENNNSISRTEKGHGTRLIHRLFLLALSILMIGSFSGCTLLPLALKQLNKAAAFSERMREKYYGAKIEEETVAVIMAAIEAYGAASGKKLRVAGIKKASSSKGGYINAWSQAARSELTRPF